MAPLGWGRPSIISSLVTSRQTCIHYMQQQTGNKLATILLQITSSMLTATGNMLPWFKRGLMIFVQNEVKSSRMREAWTWNCDKRNTFISDLCKSSKYTGSVHFSILDCTFCFLDCTKLVGLHASKFEYTIAPVHKFTSRCVFRSLENAE